jgi:hypothetical protein
MEPINVRLGNQVSVASGSAVYDEIHQEPLLDGFAYDYGRVFDHLRIQYPRDYFFNRYAG